MRTTALALLLAAGLAACDAGRSGAAGTVHAEIFSRYDPGVGAYAVEVELTEVRPDSTRVA